MYLLRQSHTVPLENALHAQRHIQYEIRKYLWVTNGLPDVQSGWQMSVWQVYCNPGIGGKDPIASKNKTKIFSKNNSNLWYFGKIWLNFVSQLKEMFFFMSHISLLEFASTNRHSWIEVNCDVSVIPDRDWAMVYVGAGMICVSTAVESRPSVELVIWSKNLSTLKNEEDNSNWWLGCNDLVNLWKLIQNGGILPCVIANRVLDHICCIHLGKV